ncbi:MAG: hypothetical protein ACRBFS_11445 [Aureispira sp.]
MSNTYTTQELKAIRQLFYAKEASNTLLALQLLEVQGIEESEQEILAILFALCKLKRHKKRAKIAQRILAKNLRKARPFLKDNLSFEQDKCSTFQLLEYLDKVHLATNLSLLFITKYLYKQSDYHPLYIDLYARQLQKLPKKEQAIALKAYWGEHVNHQTVTIRPGETKLTPALFELYTITELVAQPASAFYESISSKNLQGIEKITLIDSPTLLNLPLAIQEAPDLHTIELLEIKEIARDSWQAIKQLPKLRNLTISLHSRLTKPTGFYLFTLVNLEYFAISGQQLALDFALEKLPNLQELHISSSTQEGAVDLFAKIDKLAYLKKVCFHPALTQRHQNYLT